MRWRLFNHFRSFTVEPDVSSTVKDVLHELSQLSRIASQFREDSFLLEELRQLNNSVSQVRNEISNTLYFYLVGIAIITAGVAGLTSLYFQYKGKPSFALYTIEIFIMGTFIFSGIVSVMFIQRLLQLTKEQSESIKAINALKVYFSERLESQGINKGLLNIGDISGSFNRIPTYIRYIIIPVGSFSFSAAAYVISGLISFLLASKFSYPDTWAIAITIIVSLLVFGICFVLLELRYR